METFEGIMNLIRLEAETRNPLHARRIQLLKSALKKTGSHSDHLQKLEKNMEICDWESMTKDEFLIHLFAESADMTMSKISMEILSGKKPTMAELRNKIAETENSLWYNPNRNMNMGKYAGGAGADGGPGGGQVPQGRFCKPCNSASHWESQCFGVCPHCSMRGNKPEWCHKAPGKDLAPITLVDHEQAKTAGEKKKKKAKKVDMPVGDAGGMTGEATSSDSESESPTRGDIQDQGMANRANRVNFATANMAVRSDLNKKLSAMNPEEVKEVFPAMRAVKDDSPMTTTTVYKKTKEKHGVSVTTCWDTGCTFPISSLTVIKQLKADIIPLT